MFTVPVRGRIKSEYKSKQGEKEGIKSVKKEVSFLRECLSYCCRFSIDIYTRKVDLERLCAWISTRL